jgi:hypothetical protein
VIGHHQKKSIKTAFFFIDAPFAHPVLIPARIGTRSASLVYAIKETAKRIAARLSKNFGL